MERDEVVREMADAFCLSRIDKITPKTGPLRMQAALARAEELGFVLTEKSAIAEGIRQERRAWEYAMRRHVGGSTTRGLVRATALDEACRKKAIEARED